jgi:hypothetical protein
MNIITLLWWSLGRGNPVVPSRWQATSNSAQIILLTVIQLPIRNRIWQTPTACTKQGLP